MAERESMEFDVLIVGAGPCGLAAACRLLQLAREAGRDTSVAVVEKGAEIGAHIMSGAVLEPTALNELFPEWKALGAPLGPVVAGDEFHFLTGASGGWQVPHPFVPLTARHEGH